MRPLFRSSVCNIISHTGFNNQFEHEIANTLLCLHHHRSYSCPLSLLLVITLADTQLMSGAFAACGTTAVLLLLLLLGYCLECCSLAMLLGYSWGTARLLLLVLPLACCCWGVAWGAAWGSVGGFSCWDTAWGAAVGMTAGLLLLGCCLGVLLEVVCGVVTARVLQLGHHWGYY